MKFNTTENQYIDDMGGHRLVQYMGRCERCKSTLYAMPEGGGAFDSDPRGVLGVNHAYSWATAKDYDMTGPKVLFCYYCFQDNNETYQKSLKIAKERWKMEERMKDETINAIREYFVQRNTHGIPLELESMLDRNDRTSLLKWLARYNLTLEDFEN